MKTSTLQIVGHEHITYAEWRCFQEHGGGPWWDSVKALYEPAEQPEEDTDAAPADRTQGSL